MNLTVEEITTGITAVVMWVSIIDIAILVNVSAWATIKWLLRLMKEM